MGAPRPNTPAPPSGPLLTIGQRLSYAMALKGWGPREAGFSKGVNAFGRALGFPQGRISTLMNDKVESPDHRDIERCAEALEVRAGWILYGEEPMKRGSGIMPSAKVNLETTIRALSVRGRWSPATIAAARTSPVDLTPEGWEDALDGIEATVRKVLPRPSPSKGGT